MSIVIYHNKRCTKSRQTLQLLEERGLKLRIVNYLEEVSSKEELRNILQLLGKEPKDIIRFKENIAKELGISKKDERSLDEWLEIMVNNPILIERPIVISDKGAAIGRPPENVLSII